MFQEKMVYIIYHISSAYLLYNPSATYHKQNDCTIWFIRSFVSTKWCAISILCAYPNWPVPFALKKWDHFFRMGFANTFFHSHPEKSPLFEHWMKPRRWTQGIRFEKNNSTINFNPPNKHIIIGISVPQGQVTMSSKHLEVKWGEVVNSKAPQPTEFFHSTHPSSNGSPLTCQPLINVLLRGTGGGRGWIYFKCKEGVQKVHE